MNFVSKFLPELSVLPHCLGSDLPEMALNGDVVLGAEIDELILQRTSLAYENGKIDAQHQLMAERAGELERLERDFENRLIAERDLWSRTESAQIKTEIEKSFHRMETELSHSLCQVVKPFVKKNIAAKAVLEAEIILREVLNDPNNFKMELSGPEDLLLNLKTSLSSSRISFSVAQSDDQEVHISCDSFKISTQIETWLTKFDDIGMT